MGVYAWPGNELGCLFVWFGLVTQEMRLIVCIHYEMIPEKSSPKGKLNRNEKKIGTPRGCTQYEMMRYEC